MKASIYVGYHAPVDMLSDDIFKYIYCGSAINGEENYIKGTLRDDTGDNISYLNKRFCECTALYWMWKNDIDSDYIGFMHYRRHLNFSNYKYDENKYCLIDCDIISHAYENKFGLEEGAIKKCLSDKDIILPKKFNSRSINYKSNIDLYKYSKFCHLRDIDILGSIMKEEYEDLYKYFIEHNNDNFAYYTNIFIMKKEIFNEYCSFLFPLLFKLDEKININNYNYQEQRAVAFLSERIFDIYIRHLQNTKKFSMAEFQRTFIKYTKSQYDIRCNDCIPIVFASDNNFIKYASVCIYSIIKNSSIEKNYTIYILHSNITTENINKIKKIIIGYPHISIIFINCLPFFAKIDLAVRMHVSKETYYRFIIPNIFKNFEKVIYLDVDTILQKDISELYDINIEGYAVAGVKDYIFEGMCIKKIPTCKETDGIPADSYAKYYLNIDSTNYIQAGVLIFNIEYILKNKLDIELFSHFDKSYWFLDQDILNIVFDNHKFYLDIRWNVAHGNGELDSFFRELPVRLHDEYFKARETPFIIHFAGEKKPWIYPNISFAEEFWRYARISPFYEEILLEMCNLRVNRKLSLKQWLKQKIFPIQTKRHQMAKKIYIGCKNFYKLLTKGFRG